MATETAVSPVGTLQDVLEALSDPVRLEMVRRLAAVDEPVACAELYDSVSKSTASHHLKTLRCAGILAEREEGTRKFTWLRKAEMEERFPGLLESVLSAAARAEATA